MGNDAASASDIQKAEIQKADALYLSNENSFFHKNDVLNDYDDYDESDFDDHDTSVKNKLFFITPTTLKINPLTADFSSKTFCKRVYTDVNFSRLPRFNYISLRVFRI